MTGKQKRMANVRPKSVTVLKKGAKWLKYTDEGPNKVLEQTSKGEFTMLSTTQAGTRVLKRLREGWEHVSKL